MYFFALSHAPPVLDAEIAICMKVRDESEGNNLKFQHDKDKSYLDTRNE